MEEKIIEALRTIKEICNKQKDCVKCPFSNADLDCKICEESPKYWTLRNPDVIRYFE